jgi:hypothetical protein
MRDTDIAAFLLNFVTKLHFTSEEGDPIIRLIGSKEVLRAVLRCSVRQKVFFALP